MSDDPRARLSRTASVSWPIAVKRLASLAAMALSGTLCPPSRSCSVASMRIASPKREYWPQSTRLAFVKSATRASSCGASVELGSIFRS